MRYIQAHAEQEPLAVALYTGGYPAETPFLFSQGWARYPGYPRLPTVTKSHGDPAIDPPAIAQG